MNSFKKIISLLSIGLLAASCMKSEIIEKAPIDGQALVKFRIQTPSRSRQVTRLTGESLENNIKNIAIFVLKDGGGGFVVNDVIVVNDFQTESSTSSVFTVSLEPSVNPVKLIVLANLTTERHNEFSQPSFAAGLAAANITEAEFRSTYNEPLTATIAPADGVDPIMTMYGETTLTSVNPFSSVSLSVPLMRWVAKVDLKLDLGADSRQFVPKEIRVYRADRLVQLIPNLSAIENSNPWRVSSPSRVTGGEWSPAAPWYSVTPDPVDPLTKLFATTYVSENSTVTTPEDQTSTATCIVVGGTFDTDTVNSYYRIDFNSSVPGHAFGQILRNWQYVFNITKVTARGLTDPDEAATTVSNSMTIEVTAWNENVSKVEFVGTGDYIMLSTNALELSYINGGSKTFSVRSTVPFEWQLGTGATAGSSAQSTLTDANYSVVMTPSTPTGDYTDYTFTVTTLSVNENSADSRPSGVFITAQGATLSVNLTQAASKVLTTKVNVMSAGTSYGSLGESLASYSALGTMNTGTATQMRYLLTNTSNFGPSGTVKMGGFNLQYIEDDYFENDRYMDHIAYSLERVDVLNMCFPVNPSAGVSKAICDWLWADENRVLFVMHDTDTGNPNLIAEINSRVESSYDTTWSLIASAVGALPGVSALTIRGLPPLAVDDDNRTFLNGPFGSVTNFTSMFNVTDGTAGAMIPPLGLVPLIYYSGTVLSVSTRSPYTVLAVDTEHRIVYISESNSIHNEMDGGTTAPLPTSGTMNLIYSNLWAWVVNQVLTE